MIDEAFIRLYFYLHHARCSIGTEPRHRDT